MATVYEGMFLLDNQVVREDWKKAKSLVTGTIEKHGGSVLTARRWDERRLAYPIRGKRRATYLLTYYELPGDAMPATRRDFDLTESVLRYLWLAVDGVPEEEQALSAAENADDFTVPEPPDDDAVDEEEAEEKPSEASDKPAEGGEKPAEGGEKPAEGEKPGEGEKAADAGEKPAEGEGAGDAKASEPEKAAEGAEASKEN